MESDCKEDTFPTIMWFEVYAFVYFSCQLLFFKPFILPYYTRQCLKNMQSEIVSKRLTLLLILYTIVFIPKVHYTQNKLVLLPFSLHWILWLHMTHRMIISKRFIVNSQLYWLADVGAIKCNFVTYYFGCLHIYHPIRKKNIQAMHKIVQKQVNKHIWYIKNYYTTTKNISTCNSFHITEWWLTNAVTVSDENVVLWNW